MRSSLLKIPEKYVDDSDNTKEGIKEKVGVDSGSDGFLGVFG